MPEALVHLVFSLQRCHLVLLVPLLTLRQLVPVPLRLLPKVQAPSARIDRGVLSWRVLRALRMGGHVLQHLRVVAVRVPEVPVTPTGRLTFGVAEGALVLSASMKEPPGSVHLGSRRRRGWTSALRAVRAVTRGVVAEGARRVTQVIRRSRQGDRGFGDVQRRPRQKVVEGNGGRPCRRHVDAVQLLHLLLHRHHVEDRSAGR